MDLVKNTLLEKLVVDKDTVEVSVADENTMIITETVTTINTKTYTRDQLLEMRAKYEEYITLTQLKIGEIDTLLQRFDTAKAEAIK